ncbi:unnamed protein product, partial [Sphagnum compactum]
EITLRKVKSEERIGLTVSYSSANGSGSDDTETCTEVFITDIIPESVAARDGRLRQGDQILQVNGRDVTTKEETESLFAENKNAVTLLVSRCLYSEDQDLIDNCDEFLDEDFPPPPPAITETSITSTTFIETRTTNKDENQVNNSNVIPSADDPLHHKNIKVQMELMNQEIAALNHRVVNALSMKHDSAYQQPFDSNGEDQPVEPKQQTTPSTRKPPQFPNIPAPPPIDSDTEHIYETIPEDSESEPIYCSPYEASDQSIVEQWLKMNTSNQKQILMKKIISTNGTKQSPQQETKIWQKTTKSNSSGEEHENSSSAYNTGGSCNSNHLTLELNFSPDKDMSRSTMVLCPQKEQKYNPDNSKDKDCKQCAKHRNKDKSSSPKHIKHGMTTSTSNNKLLSPNFKDKLPKSNNNQIPMGATTMYTNMANLHQTMLLQQKLFRQAMGQQNTMTNPKHYTAPNLSQYQFVSGQQVRNFT